MCRFGIDLNHGVGRRGRGGALHGFFLTPGGDLITRDLPLSDQRGADGEALHPLWGRYFLELRVSGDRPIRTVQVASARGKVLYRTDLLEPSRAVRIPKDEKHFIGLHSRHGLRCAVSVSYDDATTD
ncbi:MAG TPA: hypothetical protein QGH10_12360, partial [Armatimonadota bacterium]|nr:hypothetical protein [Armatimonadota bacterium]